MTELNCNGFQKFALARHVGVKALRWFQAANDFFGLVFKR